MVRIALFSFKERLLLLYLVLGFTISQAQEQSASGAASLSLAGANLCLQDAFTANNNPAGLAYADHWLIAASYRNDFLIEELSSRSFTANLPLNKKAFALSGGQEGFSDYRKNRMALAYAQRLSPSFSMGLQFNYFSLQLIDPYGAQSFYTVNLGLHSQLSSKVDIAALIVNPNRVNTSETNDAYSPQIIKLGLRYNPHDFLSIFIQTEKELNHQLQTALGIQYSYKENLELRMGISNLTEQFAFGFSYRQRFFQFNLASFYHLQLGFSPSISISYYPELNEK
ncbi:MAG: hypothetical protein CMP59_05765 [Flavobacteriales bacterium]|nr:hypothetical protein [Flavobacteriales bacterium]|tara:strand:+ start:100 stop:948 length:849 start_codon:yes stop_codon:yes gene_type:complete